MTESNKQHDAMAAEAVDWRELSRRLYVELFHCDQQMRSTRDEEGEPHWTQSAVVRDVLADAKAALDGAPAQAVEPVATPTVEDVIALLHRATLEIPASLATELWKVTPLQVVWVISTLLKRPSPQPAQADARVGLTDEQREAIEFVIGWYGQSTIADNPYREHIAALRALLQGADHA